MFHCQEWSIKKEKKSALHSSWPKISYGLAPKVGGIDENVSRQSPVRGWGISERTNKIPMSTIKEIISEPIVGHEEYHIMVSVIDRTAR